MSLTNATQTFPPGPQNADPDSLLSMRGRFLNLSPEEEQYWFFSATDGLDRYSRLAWKYRLDCQFSQIAISATGLPIYGFRLGNGSRPVVILSGMHGCEPSGPRGMLAYLDALLSGEERFGVKLDRARILNAVQLHFFPFINPGGAQRFSLHFPDSWHGTWIPEWTADNKERFFSEGNEPNHYFYGTYVKKAPMRFTPDQIAEWESTGNILGSSLTDQGLDMWFDWEDTHGVETSALKEVVASVRPYCVADFHNFMYPTEVFTPTVASEGAVARDETELAMALQSQWQARGLPYNRRPPRPYPKPPEKYYEDYWFHGLGARTLIIEVNGGMLATEGAEYDPESHQRALTRRESLESVFFATSALVDRVSGHF